MSYIFGFFVVVAGAVVTKLAVPLILSLIVFSLAVGGIAAMSGGDSWIACKYAFWSALVVELLVVVLITLDALNKPW